jgi:deoxyribodipyrimidine photo-lyase
MNALAAAGAATLVWFQRDLRLEDNPALHAAWARGRPVLPVYVLEDADAAPWRPGAASRWWLHGSLEALAHALRERGAPLLLGRGPAAARIDQWLAHSGADAVYWNTRYEPWARARDERILASLQRRGIEVRRFNAALLCEPGSLATQGGAPYRLYTPFWKALHARSPAEPALPAPGRLSAPSAVPASEPLGSWSLRPSSPDWAAGLLASWTPGEAGAQVRLRAFSETALERYATQRALPGVAGTSRLSPHLHFGEVGPRQIWRELERRVDGHGAARAAGPDKFRSELAWREFSYHLLHHFPSLPEVPWRAEFAQFPWTEDRIAAAAWRRGRTGYPIVDAGMRELWSTGWMHNRVRMIVASFLVKHLLLHWRIGEAWFWDTLVDADLANNAASWQWVAGCGADAAPFFRVFNPSLQGMRFDPQGHYVRRWVPELARLPDALLHSPWQARPVDLAAAAVRLGEDYPRPLIEHRAARARALAAFALIRRRRGP